MTPPPPTTNAQPPTMTVKVQLGYVRGCPACETIARDLASTAISDPSVTGFAAMPGRKHACGAADGPPALPDATAGQQTRAAAIAAGQQELPMPAPASAGLNGFDPAV